MILNQVKWNFIQTKNQITLDKVINVLFITEVEENLQKYFRKSLKDKKNIRLIFPKNFSENYIRKLGLNAHVIIGWRPSMELLRASENLKLFINPGAGIKHHIKNFRELHSSGKKIKLINNHGNAYSTAQHAVALLLGLMNRIVFHHNQMKEGVWRTSDNKDLFSSSVQLRNRKIGLLGYGAINKHVHKFLSGFDNEFHVLKRSWKAGEDKLYGKIIKYTDRDLNKFLKASDILIIAIPQTSETEKLIKTAELKLLGKDGIVVNISRGIIVDEESLYNALSKKIISGAALDVWYNYSPKKDRMGREYPYKFPFHKLKNVLLSPHRAASPFDDLKRWDDVIENIRRLAEGKKKFLNEVDLRKEY